MIYDFKCPHGHVFEHTCKMEDRLKLVPCKGEVNQVVSDELYEKYINEDELPEDLHWIRLSKELSPDSNDETSNCDRILMRKVPCQLKAKIHVGAHNSPKSMLDHGSASNRDAAREGRYDPLKPNTRFMAKGRSWIR